MKESRLRIILPFLVFISLSFIVAAVVYHLSTKVGHTPPGPTPNASLLPQKPALAQRSLTVSDCLPLSPGFSGLRQCVTQNNCADCAESPVSCVVADAGTNVHVPVAADVADSCSGHGTLGNDGACVCSGTWNADGTCADDVCYTGKACEVAVFSIKDAGRYCLPAYLGSCDEYTADTVLTKVGEETTWNCQCKQSMSGLFAQAVEGGNCDKQIACGAAVGVPAMINVGSLTNPVFELGTAYPNRLTSYSNAQEVCVYNTQPSPMNASIIVGPASNADPTCVPLMYSNKCTITTGGGNTQILRGSGSADDPLQTRVSPPFYIPVPPGLNRCPDSWTGDGTIANPCTSPVTKSTYAFFTPTGEWLGPTITSVAELAKWWVNVPNLDPSERIWTTLSVGDVFCLENTSFATATDPDSAFCVDAACTVAEGRRTLPWKGTVDGPLLDESSLPHWVTDAPYGGHCTCDAASTVASYVELNDPGKWWTCQPDQCATSRFPTAYWDKDTKKCECTPGVTMSTPPYHTGMNFKSFDSPSICVADACNPNGVHNSAPVVQCDTDAQCGGRCHDQQCYIPFGDATACSTDLDCTRTLSGLSNRVAKCINGSCATLDMARARVNSTCTDDTHCSLGACTGLPGEQKTCTGGCVCAAGYHQVADGGASPLGFTCIDDCIGKCLNGGTCVHTDEGTECRCTPYFGGDRCETRLCSRLYQYCDASTPCCDECRCGDADQDCCNRFPREVDTTNVRCIDNLCKPVSTMWQVADAPCKIAGTCVANTWHTDTPPDCSGWGVRDDNNQCKCLPSRTGDNCEVPLCALEFQTCATNADCCNNCVCADGLSRTECCASTRDQYTPFTQCVANTCQRISS